MNIGKAVLALDDFLQRDDLADVVERLRKAAPTWLTDQLDAAADHQSRGLRRFAETTGEDHRPLRLDEVPDWVRLGLFETLLRWINGAGSTCMCSPRPSRPQPLASAAWRPGLVACLACAHLLALPRNSAADRRCDGCGHVTTGPENGDGIFPAVVQLGPLTYSVGCCRDCRFWNKENQ